MGTETEQTIDKGIDPKSVNACSVTTFNEIIDLHTQDMLEVEKIRHSNSAVLEPLKLTLCGYRLQDITRSVLIEYGKKRAKQGAEPATLTIDISFMGTLLLHATAVYGVAVSPEENITAVHCVEAQRPPATIETTRHPCPTSILVGDILHPLRLHTGTTPECAPSIVANHRFAQLGKAGKRGNWRYFAVCL